MPRSRAQLGRADAAAGADGAGRCWSTSRPGSPRTTWSPACAASAAPRAGHAGTLDPFATGLLLVLLGPATRLAALPFLPLPKTYRATARLGWRSTTGDPDGELTETGAMPDRRSSCRPGEIRQRPPDDLGGQGGGRARSTGAPTAARASRRPSARSTCTAPSCCGARATSAEFEIECSTGTYVRTLIETLGDAYCERAAAHRDRARSSRGRDGEPLDRAALASCRADPAAPRRARRTGRSVGRGRWLHEARRDASQHRGSRSGSTRRLRERLPAALDEIRSRACRAAPTATVAIGVFDGVHVGHRQVIDGRRHGADLRAAPAARASTPRPRRS